MGKSALFAVFFAVSIVVSVSSADVDYDIDDSGLFYRSYHIKLPPMKPGQIINAPPPQPEMPFPEGDVAIFNFTTRIVDANFRPVPKNIVYNHHWDAFDRSAPALTRGNFDYFTDIIQNNNFTFNAGPCIITRQLFSAGAEDNYDGAFKNNGPGGRSNAIVIPKDNFVTVTAHIIDIRGVAEDEVQLCIECDCQYLNKTDVDEHGGGVQCCPDNTLCRSALAQTEENEAQYYIEVSYRWKPYINDGSVIPVSLVFMQGPSLNNICLYEFNSPVCVSKSGEALDVRAEQPWTRGACRGNYSEVYSRWKVRTEMEVKKVSAHMHLGGSEKGVITYVDSPNEDGTYTRRMMCHHNATYGTQGTDKENLIETVRECSFDGNPYILNKGEFVTTVGTYWASANPYVNEETGALITRYPAPYGGVMANTYFYATFPLGKFRPMVSEEVDDPLAWGFGENPPVLAPGESIIFGNRNDNGEFVFERKGGAQEEEEQEEEEQEEEVRDNFLFNVPPPAFVFPSDAVCETSGSGGDIRELDGSKNISLVPEEGITLYWRVDANDPSIIALGLEFAAKAWGAVGAGESGMVNLDLVVADYVDMTLEEYYSTTYGTPEEKANLDISSINSVADCVIEEKRDEASNTDKRYFQFSRTAAKAEGQFSNPVLNDIVWAVGLAEDFSYHGPIRRGRVSIDYVESSETN